MAAFQTDTDQLLAELPGTTGPAGADAHSVVSDYTMEGWKFGSPALGTFSGTVTWALAAANYAGRTHFDATLADIGFDAGSVIATAMAAWSTVANVQFLQTIDSAVVDIRFGMERIDGPFEVIGQTTTTYRDGRAFYADVAFDLGDTYSPTGAGSPISFLLVAMHEIGHALGLGHSTETAVMSAILNEGLSGLTADDIAAVQALYGAPAPASPVVQTPEPATAASATTTPDPVPTPPRTDWPAPAGVSQGFLQLFSAEYYLSRYADVAAANLNPMTHYLQFGAHEGRDPDKLFDTVYYIARNPDVAAAGANPLEHFADFGWREGRDPGPGFDVQKYLDANPDVKLVGIDPLVHYLLYGEAEGRAIYPA